MYANCNIRIVFRSITICSSLSWISCCDCFIFSLMSASFSLHWVTSASSLGITNNVLWNKSAFCSSSRIVDSSHWNDCCNLEHSYKWIWLHTTTFASINCRLLYLAFASSRILFSCCSWRICFWRSSLFSKMQQLRSTSYCLLHRSRLVSPNHGHTLWLRKTLWTHRMCSSISHLVWYPSWNVFKKRMNETNKTTFEQYHSSPQTNPQFLWFPVS